MSAGTPARAEFRRGWPVVLAGALGTGLGISGLLTYTSGLFITDLSREIGLTRAQFGLAFFLTTVAIATALPFVGWAIDRYGARLPAALGAVALSAGFLAISTADSVTGYAVLMAATGLMAAASAPVAYARAVSQAFVHSRGLALGLMQVGIGVAAATVPPLVALVIAENGWRAGYHVLALLAAAGLLPAMLGLRGQQATDPAQPAAAAPDFSGVLRNRLFWLQMAAFVVMALAFAGMLPNFVPMLRDAGMSPARAGALAGLIGLSVIASRILVGWLSDVTDAPRVAAGACAVCAGGCLALAFGGPALAPVAAISLGAAMGAEADLVGFLTARYFGLATYGRAYALQYSAFLLATGLSPVWVGMVADATGSYRWALIGCSALLAVAIALFLALPSTRRQ